MRALLRPLFVGGLSVAIAAAGLLGSSSVAFAASKPSITTWNLGGLVYEGDRPPMFATFTDGTDNDAYSVEIDWGDGSQNDVFALANGARDFGPNGLQKSVPYVNDGAVRIVITLNDGLNATSRFIGTTVLNAAPSMSSFALSSATVDTGHDVTATGAFTDAGAADTHSVTVDWGDGSTPDSAADLSAGVTTFGATHVFADTGTYSVVVTLSDSASHTVTASSSVSPTNVAPAVGSLSLSPSSVVDHQTVTVSGSFTDPGTADSFTLTLNWGDGTSSSQSLSAGTRSFSASHAYNAAGPVTIQATVADRDLAKSSSSAD